jgi:ribosomal protein S18 acetylase RimI-like enzyme
MVRPVEMLLPAPYVARAYRGPVDHPILALILGEYKLHSGAVEIPTAAQFDVSYANLVNCDLAVDFVLVETQDGEPVAYARAGWEELDDGSRDYIVFAPTRPAFLAEPLFAAMVAGQEDHLRAMAAGVDRARFRAYAPHAGPGLAATGEAAWLEAAGYRPVRFSASLVRPHLDGVPELPLPEGVEIRAVQPEHLHQIWESHWEAFRGQWDSHDATESDYREFLDNPLRDESMWKIAWHGDTVVGQVKSYINHEENADLGFLRGYTEEISTHAEWRNRGIAGALLAASLIELKDRGMTEAALSADTESTGGAFHLYTKLGFELRSYEAAYAKPID